MSQQPTLTPAERQFLAFALDLAADHMANRGDEFTDEDHAALERLRVMTVEPEPLTYTVHIASTPQVKEIIRNIVRRGPGEAGMTL